MSQLRRLQNNAVRRQVRRAPESVADIAEWTGYPPTLVRSVANRDSRLGLVRRTDALHVEHQ